MNTKKFALILAACLVSVLAVPPASAGFIATMQESGPNVVVAGSGTLDLTALAFLGSGNFSKRVRPIVGELRLPVGSVVLDAYGTISGPLSFGTGGITTATGGTGSGVGVLGTGGSLYVPQGYISGSALSATSTYSGQTIASLGATPGTYIWSWGSGGNRDTFILNIVPEPSTFALAGLGLLSLVCRRRNHV